MDDLNMIVELRRRAESKAMTRVLLDDIGVSLVPASFSDIFPDLEKTMRDKDEMEYGSLSLAADLIEGTYTGNPIDLAKLAAMLRKSAEDEENFAWREDSAADDKKANDELRELGMFDDDEEEDEDDESEEEHREFAETARETAKFYRDVADRVERGNFNDAPTT